MVRMKESLVVFMEMDFVIDHLPRRNGYYLSRSLGFDKFLLEREVKTFAEEACQRR
jgi:hypothetical protein